MPLLMGNKLRKAYVGLATLLLGVLLAFLAVNGILYAVGYVWSSSSRRAAQVPWPIQEYGEEAVLQAYPNWKREDVVQLLRETWNEGPAFEYEPITQFRVRPFRGKYVNVSEAGFRLGSPQGPWPPSAEAFNVFVFGGSTAFGVGLADSDTIPSALQEYARCGGGKRVAVYNFGRGNYFSTQEALLFYSLALSRTTPHLAIFIDGLNDFLSVKGEPQFTGALREFMQNPNRPLLPSWSEKLPLFQLARRLGRTSKAAAPPEDYQDPAVLERIVQRWLSNKKVIEAVARAFDVKPVFVWQPVPVFRYDLNYDFVCRGDIRRLDQIQRAKFGYERMDRLRKQLEESGDFLWLGDMQEAKKENLYVDRVHYTAAFSRVIALRIHDFLRSRDLLACDREGLR